MEHSPPCTHLAAEGLDRSVSRKFDPAVLRVIFNWNSYRGQHHLTLSSSSGSTALVVAGIQRARNVTVDANGYAVAISGGQCG